MVLQVVEVVVEVVSLVVVVGSPLHRPVLVLISSAVRKVMIGLVAADARK